jgi:hypothetical protein
VGPTKRQLASGGHQLSSQASLGPLFPEDESGHCGLAIKWTVRCDYWTHGQKKSQDGLPHMPVSLCRNLRLRVAEVILGFARSNVMKAIRRAVGVFPLVEPVMGTEYGVAEAPTGLRNLPLSL